jgi:hypothetical protein
MEYSSGPAPLIEKNEEMNAGQKEQILEDISSKLSQNTPKNETANEVASLISSLNEADRKPLRKILTNSLGSALAGTDVFSVKTAETILGVLSPEMADEVKSVILYKTGALNNRVDYLNIKHVKEFQEKWNLSSEATLAMLNKALVVEIEDAHIRKEAECKKVKEIFAPKLAQAQTEEEKQKIQDQMQQSLAQEEEFEAHVVEKISTSMQDYISTIMEKLKDTPSL